jgi:hypothetical protein
MARVAVPLVLQSPVSGSALVGASFTFTKHVVGGSLGSGEAATIYTTETENTPTGSNTITTDSTGRLTQGEAATPAFAQYWIPEGRYDILISGPGLKSVYITRELVTTEGIAAAEAVAAAALTARMLLSPLTLTTQAGSYVAKSGDLVYATGSGSTITIPVTLNAITAVTYAQSSGELTVKAASGIIVGDFLSAAFCKLLANQHLLLIGDGSNARIIAGEPKREQVYSARKMATKEEAETGFIPSLTRPVQVVLSWTENVDDAVKIGGVTVKGNSPFPFTFICPAGVRWQMQSLPIEYSYLVL